MFELLIPFLVFAAVMMVGVGIVMASRNRRRAIEPRLQPLPMGSTDRFSVEEPALARMAGRLGRLFFLGGASTGLKERLAQAGYYSDSAAPIYFGTKVIMLFLGGAGGATLLLYTELTTGTKVYLGILSAVALFFLPNMFVAWRRRRRSAMVRNSLPDAIDLLEICVSAGLGLDMAWNAVSDEIRQACPILGDEMALVNLEVQLGVSRTEAMRNMATRTRTDDLTALVALLVQSDRFGTSIADALRTFASSMRAARSFRAEESAEKMAVKLLLPLVLFIFPVMLIVMAGPACMVLYEVMGK